jgi:NAD-dependent oxidoreductase involved in siderophore biosynthesis
MHRLCLSWMASLLLLLAQHGALLHELSHLAHNSAPAGTSLRESPQGLESGLCLTCEAYSQVTNPATAVASHVPLTPAAFLPSSTPDYGIVAANAPTPRSRGPPQA